MELKMTDSNEEKTLLEKRLDQGRYKGLDEIYYWVSENSWYPLVMALVTQGIIWTTIGMLVVSPVIIAAKPDNFACSNLNMTGNDFLCNQTELFCKEYDAGTCDQIQFSFNGNWTTETLVTQFGLVCKQKKYLDNINSASLAGLMIGALVFGNLADRYGRKALMISCCIGASIVCFLQEPLSNISLYGFIVARVVMLALIYGAAIAQFVYAVEISPPRYRMPIGLCANLMFSIGVGMLTPVALASRNWKEVTFILGACPLLALFILPFTRDSFRWYHARSRLDHAKVELKRFLIDCNAEIEAETINEILSGTKSTDAGSGMFQK